MFLTFFYTKLNKKNNIQNTINIYTMQCFSSQVIEVFIHSVPFEYYRRNKIVLRKQSKLFGLGLIIFIFAFQIKLSYQYFIFVVFLYLICD